MERSVSLLHEIAPALLPNAQILSDPPPTHRERLRIGFTFSRWFILTYQAAIVAVLFVVTVRNLFNKLTRKRRRSKSKQIQRETHSSAYRDAQASNSSSTSGEGCLTPPDSKAFTEQTPLLAFSSQQARQNHSLWTAIHSGLMYQPAPLPVFNRTMPSNGCSLMISALFGLNLFYLCYRVDIVEVLSDRAGLLFVANLPWLYLLAAKNQPMQLLTGHSYENLNILHRRLGELLCALAAVHTFGMLLAWYSFLRPLGVELIRFLTIRYILFGIGAFFSYELLYFTSLASFRSYWYEMFLGSHIFLQTAGLVLLFLHHHRGRPYVGVALGIFLVDRLVFRFGMKFRSFQADLKVLDDGDTVLVSASWPINSRRKSFWGAVAGWGMRHGWQPTEHVFISVPALGRKHIVQYHPITIASAAPAHGNPHAWFNLLIRAKTGFSRDLLRFSETHASTRVWLDGPYGSSHALEMLRSSDAAIVVAGGSGIAVAYPLIWDLLQRHKRQDSVEALTGDIDVCLIWVVQDAKHIDWIGHERLDELRGMGLQVTIPPPTNKQGRPDIDSLLRAQIGALEPSLRTSKKTGVVVSGPDGLNRAARNTCARMVRRGYDVEVAVEKFGW